MGVMASLKFLLHVLVLCVCFTYCVCLNFTAKEKAEFHRQFKLYNKPAVKVIETIHGDTYSCVDFYKQPAFDHPSLKNHSYHPEMFQFSSKVGQHENNPKQDPSFKNLWVNKEGCPHGTIPIRKYTKKQFFQSQKAFQKLYPSDDPEPGRYRSSVHTKNGPHTFYGGSAAMNYYNYPIDETQYSAGYFLIRAANDQLQFGWIIFPELYLDGKTRLFITTTVERKKCFTFACGGYVHTNKDIPIDAVLDPTTVRGENYSTEIVPKIFKDPKSNTWQLYGTYNNLYGFWPNEVLSGLKGPAEYLEWGGESYNPNGLKGPPMGSGFFPEGQLKKDGYARKIVKFDQGGKEIDVGADETESYADDSNLYRIQDAGYINDVFGHLMYYGGPGKQ